ncbi:hypothetical protein [Cyanobium sp. ULC065]
MTYRVDILLKGKVCLTWLPSFSGMKLNQSTMPLQVIESKAKQSVLPKTGRHIV